MNPVSNKQFSLLSKPYQTQTVHLGTYPLHDQTQTVHLGTYPLHDQTCALSLGSIKSFLTDLLHLLYLLQISNKMLSKTGMDGL